MSIENGKRPAQLSYFLHGMNGGTDIKPDLELWQVLAAVVMITLVVGFTVAS